MTQPRPALLSLLGALLIWGAMGFSPRPKTVPTVREQAEINPSPVTYAFALNKGRNTISVYRLGADGALDPLPRPVVPTGYQPESLALSPDGHFLYAADEGEATISEYRVGSDGTLTPLNGPRVRTGEFPVSICATQTAVYVVCHGGSASGLWQFRAAPDGTLAPMRPPSLPTGESPLALAVSPDGRFAYSASFDDRIHQFSVGPGGTLRPLTPARAPLASYSLVETLVFAPDGRSLYAVNMMGNTLQRFRVGSNGALTPLPGVVTGAAGLTSLCLAFGGGFAYVGSNDDRGVFGYRVGAEGQLTPLKPGMVKTPAKPKWVAISPDGRWLYVIADGSRRLRRYRVGPDGGLTGAEEQVLAEEPDGLTFAQR